MMAKGLKKGKKIFLQEVSDDSSKTVLTSPDGDKYVGKFKDGKYQSEEAPELDVEMNKQDFLDSIGLGKRPGSQLAIDKWEEYRSK
jgi:hypothetical protein